MSSDFRHFVKGIWEASSLAHQVFFSAFSIDVCTCISILSCASEKVALVCILWADAYLLLLKKAVHISARIEKNLM